MRILLIGYGKMGKAIERIALERGHTIAGKIDLGSGDQIADADVAIEFTQPEAAPANIRACFAAGIPVVCGTTGWLSEMDAIKSECRAGNHAFFYASNYSLGVNVFFKVNEYLARLMNGQTGYQISLTETHHTQKKDAPSGTAITIAEGILKNNNQKKGWSKGHTNDPSLLGIESLRIDPAPGTHTVKYQSAIDDIEITHTAHSREGFALGAVLVAEWIKGRKGCLTMDEFLEF